MGTEKNNTAEGIDGARKLVDLEVREVSLVDHAAIQRTFLIVKRLDNSAPVETTVTEPSFEAGVTRESLVKVMDGLKEANISGAEPAIFFLSKVLASNMPDVKTAESLLEETIKMDPTTQTQAGQQEGAQATPASTQAPVAKNDAAPAAGVDTGTASAAPVAAPQTPKTKALSLDGDAVPAVQIMNDGSVVVSGQSVHKGKGFTSSRTNTLKDAASMLANLLKDVDPAALGEVLDSLKAELPSGTTVSQQVVPHGTAGGVSMAPGPENKSAAPAPAVTAEVAKAADQEPAWVADLRKSVKGLEDKIATIEKARSPSTAATNEGGTDNANTTEVQKQFWNGILS